MKIPQPRIQRANISSAPTTKNLNNLLKIKSPVSLYENTAESSFDRAPRAHPPDALPQDITVA